MTLPDLLLYNYQQLKDIRDKCCQLMMQKKEEEIATIRAELEARAEALEISPLNILEAYSGSHRKKSSAVSTYISKYRDPISGAEWSGKGRGMPGWMKSAISNGEKTKRDFINPDWLTAKSYHQTAIGSDPAT